MSAPEMKPSLAAAMQVPEIKALVEALKRIESGVVPETDPDTGLWVECNMSEDEMQDIARAAIAAIDGGLK